MIRQKCLVFFVLATLSGWSAVQADSLLIENIDKSRAALTERPKRGMSMDTVASNWGQPTEKNTAIGEPPISRWEYSTFIVYFEYQNVIHAVTKH